MKRLLLTVVSIVAIGNAAFASDKADFSGTWKMNPAKSEYGQFPAPTAFIRKIDHKEPSLTVVEDQSQGGMNATTTRAMTTDGKVAENTINGAPVNCSATWDGPSLTVTTAVGQAGVRFVDKMSLSPGGKELTSTIHVEFPQGSGELKVVFDRQ